ncbi:MAG: nitrous oxide-stimulated promoter family protein [Firmicutes bacterium]|nr:nitrous oxide-stimulated promoter family protein [Bacillota bacterium]
MSAKRDEKKIVTEMIALYCKKNHKAREKGRDGRFCEACEALREYAMKRSDSCPFGENKTFCSNCRVHCYKPQMREQIRQVMRFAGPRMLLHHPVLAVSHLVETKKEKKKLEETT